MIVGPVAAVRLLDCVAMNIDRIRAELKSERDRLDRAIAALEAISTDGTGKQAGRTSAKRPMSAAARKKLSQLLKRRWAQGKMGKRKHK